MSDFLILRKEELYKKFGEDFIKDLIKKLNSYLSRNEYDKKYGIIRKHISYEKSCCGKEYINVTLFFQNNDIDSMEIFNFNKRLHFDFILPNRYVDVVSINLYPERIVEDMFM